MGLCGLVWDGRGNKKKMASSSVALDVHVGAKGGLFVYKNGHSGAKRYLSGDSKQHIKDPVQLAHILALKVQWRITPATKTSSPIAKEVSDVHGRTQPYGILPAQLPRELTLLVAEMLEGDIWQGATPTDLSQEQHDWEAIIDVKCAETKETCADLVRKQATSGRERILCRARCVRQYKAERASLSDYLAFVRRAGIPSMVWVLESDEWKLTSYVRLRIGTGPRGYQLRLIVGVEAHRDPTPEEAVAVTKWRHSIEYEAWKTFAATHDLSQYISPYRSDQDATETYESRQLNTKAATDIVTSFLWTVEHGTLAIHSDRERAHDDREVHAIAETHPGLTLLSTHGAEFDYQNFYF
jgi:hypothetical protein